MTSTEFASDQATQTSPRSSGRIVIGVDGSESSKRALQWAQFLAGTTGAHVEAIFVAPIAPAYAWAGAFWGAAPGESEVRGAAEKLLTAAVDDVFGTERPADLVLSVAEGSAAEALLARGKSAQMIVVGSRGHGGFAGLLLGSVSAAVAEHASCPVLVVHGDTPPAA
jgi:nucleotide-binding universal stress UspA family protein